jgi:hypothetical protein
MQLRLRSKQQTTEASKPKFVRRPRVSATASFAQIVKEAIAVTKELYALNEPRAQKLSAAALTRSLLAAIQSTPARIKQLRAALEKATPGLDHARATLRRMVTFLRSRNAPLGPIRDPGRLLHLSTRAADAELALIKASPYETFCVAVSVAAEKHPEAFGDCDDPEGFAERLAELKRRQAELFDKIGASFTPDDLHIPDGDAQGRSTVSFKIAPEVPIHPRGNAGERLITFLLTQQHSS